jgi:hypothetical protein
MLWYSPPLALVALRLLVLPAGVMLLLARRGFGMNAASL